MQIIFMIILCIIAFSFSLKFDIGFIASFFIINGAILALLFSPSIIVAIIESNKEAKMKKSYSNPNTSEKEKIEIAEYFKQKKIEEENAMAFNKKYKEETIGTLSEVKYVGGHESYTNQTKVDIRLTDRELIVHQSMKNGYPIFSIPTYEIKNIKYSTSNDISTSKLIMFGIGAYALKNHYLVVEYVNKYGITNEVIFDTGTKVEQKFFNNLNAIRNKASQNNRKSVSYFEIED